MLKRQVFPISLLFLFFSLIWCIPGVSASTITSQQTETVTPTPPPMEGSGIAQLKTFGNPEIDQIFTTSDQKKYLISFDDQLNVFEESNLDSSTQFELPEEFDNTILDVNETGELVALSADSGFYIFNTSTKLKSTVYRDTGIDYYAFYSFLPHGNAFLYGVHHSSSGGSSTDLHIRGTDENKNIISQDLKRPSDAPAYFGFSSPIPSPDGNYIAAGYSDFRSNRILVWKVDAKDIYYEINNLPAAITTLDISPDSNTLASAGGDGMIRLWNLETGEFIESISGFNCEISSIKYTNKGNVLSISTRNGHLYNYNFVSGQLKETTESAEMQHPLIVQKIDEGYILKSKDRNFSLNSPASLVFSPDGNKLALIEGSVQVWEAGEAIIRNFLPDSRFGVTNASFDASGERLAVLSDQGEVYVWNIDNGKTELHIPFQKMLDNQAPYTTENISDAVDNDLSDFSNQNIVFSPDGQQIAFANGMNIEIWNIVLAAKNKTLSTDGLSGRPEKLVFSENGETITAVTNNDQSLVTWNIRTGEIIDQFELAYNAGTHGKTTNLSNSNFVSLNHTDTENWLDLWNLQTHESVKLDLANNTLFSTAFNSNGTLFSTIDNAKNLYVWRTDTGQLLYYEKGFSINSTIAINPSGTTLATAENGQITLWDLAPITEKGFRDDFVSPTLIPSEQNGGFTYNTEPTATPTITSPTATEQQSETAQEPTKNQPETTADMNEKSDNESLLLKAQQNHGIITSMVWKNNKLLLSSTTGLYSYDIAKEDLSMIFTNEEMDISSIEGSGNTNYMTAGITNKNQIQLWNANKSEQLLSTTGFAEPIISPNKKLMAYYLGNFRYMLWNISEEQSQFILPGYTPSAPLAFSPDSKYLAIAQNTGLVQVWNTSSGTIEYAFNGGKVACTNIHFSSDGKSLIGVAGGSAWIWQLSSNALPIEIEVYSGEAFVHETYFEQVVTAADINYNNEILAIADKAGTIRFYTLDDHNLYRNMSQPKYEITHLAFSPNDNQFVSVDINGNVSIWDADTSELLNEINFFSGSYHGMHSLDDGNLAIWTKNQITMIDPETLESQEVIKIDAETIFDVSRDGKWAVAYTPYSIRLFDLSIGELSTTLTPEAEIIMLDRFDDFRDEQAFYGASFSANSEYLITYGSGGAWVYKLNQNNIGKTNLMGNVDAQQIYLAEFNNDGSQFILSTGEGYLRPKVYETNKQTEIVELPLAEHQVNFMGGQEYSVYAFHPDQERAILLRSGLYGSARLEMFDLSSGEVINFIRYESTKADALAISPDRSQIAVGFDTGQIRIYSSDNLTMLSEFYAHPAAVNNLVFSNNDDYLISTGEEGAIKSWIIE